MSLRLILTRHAKSSWDDPALGDHDRPLNKRGERAASMIGEWLNRNGYHPGQVLSSSSVRTRQTWDLIARALPDPPEAEFLPALYHADPDAMLGALHRASQPTVMLIGHNPGCASFASAFARRPAAHARFDSYPTAATTIFDVEASEWHQASWGAAQITNFIVPRDL